MAIPFRPTGMIGFAKELDTRTRVSRTDIERLWRLMDQQSVGETFGNDPANPILGYPGYGGGGGGGTSKVWEGFLTSDLAAPINGMSGATTATAQSWDSDPSSVTTPVGFIATSDPPYSIVNRDRRRSAPSGTYCQWVEVPLLNGGTEYRFVHIESCWRWAKLTTTLTAPATSLTTPTTGTVNVYDRTSGSFGVTTDSRLLGLSVKNYDTSLKATVTGLICAIDYEDGEWVFKWVGC